MIVIVDVFTRIPNENIADYIKRMLTPQTLENKSKTCANRNTTKQLEAHILTHSIKSFAARQIRHYFSELNSQRSLLLCFDSFMK